MSASEKTKAALKITRQSQVIAPIVIVLAQELKRVGKSDPSLPDWRYRMLSSSPSFLAKKVRTQLHSGLPLAFPWLCSVPAVYFPEFSSATLGVPHAARRGKESKILRSQTARPGCIL